jgi:hypothetical protein
MIPLKELSKDSKQLAAQIVKLATEEPQEPPKPERSPISEYLSRFGIKAGPKGVRPGPKNLSPKRREEIARKATQAR